MPAVRHCPQKRTPLVKQGRALRPLGPRLAIDHVRQRNALVTKALLKAGVVGAGGVEPPSSSVSDLSQALERLVADEANGYDQREVRLARTPLHHRLSAVPKELLGSCWDKQGNLFAAGPGHRGIGPAAGPSGPPCRPRGSHRARRPAGAPGPRARATAPPAVPRAATGAPRPSSCPPTTWPGPVVTSVVVMVLVVHRHDRHLHPCLLGVQENRERWTPTTCAARTSKPSRPSSLEAEALRW